MKNLISAVIIIVVLTACNRVDPNNQLVNEKAGLPVSFHFDHLGLKLMASFVNRNTGTMSVLYVRPIVQHGNSRKNYLGVAGNLFALVTWKKQEDRHWFGANIPGALQSVELISISTKSSGILTAYQKYTGKDLKVAKDTLGQHNRISYILGLRPSVMP
jgi:hypothetical protein